MSRRGYIIAMILIILGLLCFFYLDPFGVKIGYRINGGKDIASVHEINPDVILHEYENQMDTYDRYRSSDNPTAQKWAEAAREKANELADQYNELVGEFVLNGA